MKLIKQRNIPRLGAFFNLLYLCLPILALFSYVGVALTTYATFVITFVPWLPFWIYIVACVVGAFVVLFLFWIFVYLGYFNNPIGQDVKKIKIKLGITE